MIFTDWKFFAFFAVAFGVYWGLRGRTARKLWILLASAVFYAAWDWRFLFLIGFVVINTYATGLAVARAKDPTRRKRFLTVGVGLSLSVLGFFKYFEFFRSSLAELLASWHLALPQSTLTVLLPVGISFYTFHSLSYLIDVYRGKIPATRDLLDIACYILFFPQLVAGPILRATSFLPQLREDKRFWAVDWRSALLLFLVGYFKKTCIADNLAALVDPVFAAPQDYATGDAIIAVSSYTVQIYCDFSGYTDMAIAVAAMLGYQLPLNFAHPYLATSPADFWRRWHISLSSWLRDYLYIPLGGNRHGAAATLRNLMVTMLLGGLWHGASWTFVFWGGLHGLGLVAQRVVGGFARMPRRVLPPAVAVVLSAISVVATFLWVAFAWIFFRAPSFADAAEILAALTRWGPPTLVSGVWFALGVGALILVHLVTDRVDVKAWAKRPRDFVFAFGYGIAVALILPLVNVKVTPFIYFQF